MIPTLFYYKTRLKFIETLKNLPHLLYTLFACQNILLVPLSWPVLVLRCHYPSLTYLDESQLKCFWVHQVRHTKTKIQIWKSLQFWLLKYLKTRLCWLLDYDDKEFKEWIRKMRNREKITLNEENNKNLLKVDELR